MFGAYAAAGCLWVSRRPAPPRLSRSLHRPEDAALQALLAARLPSACRAPQAQCRALMPIGGGGVPAVEQCISPDRLVGRITWNTDFAVDRACRSDRVNLQSVLTGRGTFPLAVFLSFTNGSHLLVVNQNLTRDPQQQRRLGPVPAVSGERTSQGNAQVGSSAMPGSTGFSYCVLVEGCNGSAERQRSIRPSLQSDRRPDGGRHRQGRRQASTADTAPNPTKKLLPPGGRSS